MGNKPYACICIYATAVRSPTFINCQILCSKLLKFASFSSKLFYQSVCKTLPLPRHPQPWPPP